MSALPDRTRPPDATSDGMVPCEGKGSFMFADRCRVEPARFRLADCDPADTAGLTAEAARTDLDRDLAEMFRLQDRLYAWKEWASSS